MVGTKQERLANAFDYLKSHGLAHSQQDVADKMKSDKSNLSKAFKGETRFLTDKFLRRFNSAYGDLFSEDWLLTGSGSMLRDSLTGSVTVGDNNGSVAAGVGCTVGSLSTEALVSEIAAQRKLTEEAQRQNAKSQEQIDRLLSIIEKSSK